MVTPRDTIQKRTIRGVFQSTPRPLDAKAVLDRAQGDIPNLGLATVYRNINAGVEEGWLVSVEIPGAPTHYELSGKRHHHHFECRNCRRIYDIPGCPGNLEAMLPEGFTLEDHEVLLFGLCQKCSGQK